MARVSRNTYNLQKDVALINWKWLTGLYLRLSDEDERSNEENSIGNQKKICMDYLKREEDMQVAGVYIDNGTTGTNFQRDGFIRLMNDIRRGRINCVIVKDLSRFGRNYLEAGEYLEKIFPDLGVRFIAVNNDYDSEKGTEKMQSIAVPFSNMVNELYAKDTSRKIRTSIDVLIKKGEFVPAAGSIPYGYLRDEKNHTYQIDAETAEVVKLVFAKKLDGMSNCGIAAYLNKKNIPSPGRIRYLRGVSKDKRNENALWTHKMIKQMLCNEVYLGHRVHGKVKKNQMGGIKKEKTADAWVYVYHAHLPIIEESDFAKVQELLASDRERRCNYTHRKSVGADQRELLKGKVFCGDCGALMSTMKRNQRLTSDKEPELFYQCNGYQYSGRMVCKNHYLPQKVLLEKLEKSLKLQIQIALDIENSMNHAPFAAHRQTETDEDTHKIREIEQEVKRIKSKMERMLFDYNEGLLDKQEYLYMKEHYQVQLADMECQRVLLEAERDMQKDKDTHVRGWIDTLKGCQTGDIPGGIMLDRELIDELIDKIYVFEDRSIEIWFRFRDEFMEITETMKKWGEMIQDEAHV